MKIYWFEVVDEESELCGEEFFVEAESPVVAWDIATKYFYVELECHGIVSWSFAEMMGYDTY